MQIHYKEKALLANQYKIEKAEHTKNWIGKNWIKVALFGVFMSVAGPVWTHQPDGIYRQEAISAVDVSDFGHLGTGIAFAIVYTICMFIAYFTGNYQDNKKIARLKKERVQLQEDLILLQNASEQY